MTEDLRALSTARIRLVTGLPCSGKTTYVEQHSGKRDVVIDFDAIAVALGSPDSHDHPKSIIPYVIHVRNALLSRIEAKKPTTDVWIISTAPSDRELSIADEVIRLDADKDTCKKRALIAGRPAQWASLIDRCASPK